MNLIKKHKGIVIFSFAFLLFQMYSIYNYYFYTDWDCAQLVDLSNAIAHNEDVSRFSWYYSVYPNNLFLAAIYASIRKAAHLIGLHEAEYFIVLCFQCVLCWITGILLYLNIGILTSNKKLQYIGYSLFIILVGMSPWISIPYSDTMGLIFPMIVLFFLNDTNINISDRFRWGILAFISYIGFKIKPQLFIVLIAILLVEIFYIKNKKMLLQRAVGIIIGLFAAFIVSGLVTASTKVEVDNEKSFHIYHFFMMGMNVEDGGMYSQDDVDYSLSFDSSKERDKANLDRAFDRIHDMGCVGLGKHLFAKLKANYNDGTFCWGKEGTVFFCQLSEDRNTKYCDFIRSLYYSQLEDNGNYKIWNSIEQIVWYLILFLCVLSIFKLTDKHTQILILSIIGLTVFEIIFEARSRYLFAYVPVYIMLAMNGIGGQPLAKLGASLNRDKTINK